MEHTKQTAEQTTEQKSPAKGSTRIERGIYRVHYPSHKGYRAYLKFKGIEYQKVFAFGDDPEQALAKARQWREDKLREIQSLPDAGNPLKKIMKNNVSGISGVRRGKTAWIASWVENGKLTHRWFAVSRHGEQQAFKNACQVRADAEKRLYGQVFQPALIENL